MGGDRYITRALTGLEYLQVKLLPAVPYVVKMLMPKIKAFAETKRNRFLNEITLMAIYVKRVPLYAPHGKRAAS